MVIDGKQNKTKHDSSLCLIFKFYKFVWGTKKNTKKNTIKRNTTWDNNVAMTSQLEPKHVTIRIVTLSQ